MGVINRRDFLTISSAFLAGSTVLGGGFVLSPYRQGEVTSLKSDKVVKTTCELCFWRCGIDAHVKDGKVFKIAGQKDHPLSNGKLCPRGLGGHGLLYDPDRLKHPLIRKNVNGKSSFHKATWDEATTLIASRLSEITEEHGPESVAMFSHGFGASFFKTLLSAYGIDTFTAPSYGQCRGPRTEAFKLTFGHGVGSPEGLDIANSKYLVLIGSHLGENMHNTQVQEFSQAIAKGCRIVAVDPRFSTAAGKAETWLPIKAGTDIALLRSWIHILIEEKLYDEDFIAENAIGLSELKKSVRDATPEKTFAITGIPVEMIVKVARDLGRYQNQALVHPGRHVTWYGDDTQRERAIAILNALLGNYRAKGGLLSQKTYPIPKYDFPKPKKSSRKFKSVYPFAGSIPSNEIVDRTLADSPESFKAWFIYGTNLIHTLGDQKSTIEALRKLKFVVAVDVLPMEITGYADVVLPECTYLERFDDLDARAYKKPYLAIRQPAVKPLFDSKPGFEIARMLSKKMGLPDLFPDKIETYLESRLKKIGHSLVELQEKGVFVNQDSGLYRSQNEKMRFDTPSGKIELVSNKLREKGFDPVPKYTQHPENPPGFFRLLFGRAPMHTFGRTANNRILGELMPENELWVNAVAGQDMKLKNGEYLYLVNQDNIKSKTPIRVRLTQRIRPDVVFMVHGFGHTDPRLKTARNRGASDADLISHLDVDPIMGGTGMNNNFVTFTREA
ncbi:MAG: molybdopterin-dependent oxidoreductase [Deltaproteobacteria bacterium]|nr:molybdopterin-dependent oxidoreductase [Deltaproteobacteria bacterium]